MFRLSESQIVRRVKVIAKAAGLSDCEFFSGHSGRVGMARRMAQNGVPTHEIERQGRWKQGGGMVGRYTPRRIRWVGFMVSMMRYLSMLSPSGLMEQVAMVEKEPQTWEAVADRLPGLLNKLTENNPIVRNSRGRLPMIPEKGIYVFYESGKPLYVGRSDRMRSRILEHGRPSSLHNAATFAFLLGMEMATCKGIDCAGITRDDLQIAGDFKPLYDQAKERVRSMQVRVVEISDAIEQSVFEVYAALHLNTTRDRGGYNDFENH